MRVLQIMLGRRFVAIDAEIVSSVVETVSVHPVPLAPSWVEGLALDQGQVVAVVNLGSMLNLEVSAGPYIRCAIDESPFVRVSSVGSVRDGVIDNGICIIDGQKIEYLDLGGVLSDNKFESKAIEHEVVL